MTGREKFEALIKDRFGDCVSLAICKNSDGDYLNWDAQVAWFAYQAALASQQPADDGWVEWAGGECPVHEDAIVEMKWKYGDVLTNRAGIYQWSYYEYGDRIIAYRVVKP